MSAKDTYIDTYIDEAVVEGGGEANINLRQRGRPCVPDHVFLHP